jgi:hypothetical protein
MKVMVLKQQVENGITQKSPKREFTSVILKREKNVRRNINTSDKQVRLGNFYHNFKVIVSNDVPVLSNANKPNKTSFTSIIIKKEKIGKKNEKIG